jgi:CxxC-x17-CxxC domain-containing protein
LVPTKSSCSRDHNRHSYGIMQALPTRRPGCVGGRVQGQFEGDVHNLFLPVHRLPREWTSRYGLKGEPSSMEFKDKMLKCIDCGADFVFTAGEQLFFHDKQFRNEPKRCKACKSKRVAVLNSSPPPPRNYSYSKVETRATCSQCGKDTTVPFRPTQGRPVLCRECFSQKRTAASA